MNFLEIKQAAYASLGYGSSPPTDVASRFGAWINEGYRVILRTPGFTDLRIVSFELATVADQKTYPMAISLERIDSIANQTNRARLRQMTRDQLWTVDPDETQSGQPTHWISYGYEPVYLEPAATGVWAASSSAADVTQTVTIQGIDDTGVTRSAASAVLTGAARVALGSITNYLQLTKFILSAVAVGEVTLYDAAIAGNALGKIIIGDKSVSYQMTRFWPTPTAADAYIVEGLRTISDLSADTDIPIFPAINHDLLVTYARVREYERTGKQMGYQIAKTDWERGVRVMRANIEFPPDYRPVSGVGAYSKQAGWNGLTGEFPADE